MIFPCFIVARLYVIRKKTHKGSSKTLFLTHTSHKKINKVMQFYLFCHCCMYWTKCEWQCFYWIGQSKVIASTADVTLPLCSSPPGGDKTLMSVQKNIFQASRPRTRVSSNCSEQKRTRKIRCAVHMRFLGTCVHELPKTVAERR